MTRMLEEQIEETYRMTKEEVTKLGKNVKNMEKENVKLKATAGTLKTTETKLHDASELLKGDVADLKVISGKVKDMNKQAFETIVERQTLSGKQSRIILAQQEEELDMQSEDVINRMRAYFDDAAGENSTIEEKEYETLSKHIMSLKALEDSDFKMLKFSDYSDEYDDDAKVMEKFEMTMKLRPLLKDFFEKKKESLRKQLKESEKEDEAKFDTLKQRLQGERTRTESQVQMLMDEQEEEKKTL